MAQITRTEFERAIGVLAGHFGLDRTRDKLARFGAFRSRRGLASIESLTERLFRLSGGLRIQSGATYAFSALWAEMLSALLGNDGEEKIDGLADGVNSCLGEGDEILEGKEKDLDAALSEYHQALADKVGSEVASLDMLLKSVPEVADRLRNQPPAAAPAGAEPADDASSSA